MAVKCYLCETELTGGLDTFGEIHWPMCWACWSGHFDNLIRTVGPAEVRDWWEDIRALEEMMERDMQPTEVGE